MSVIAEILGVPSTMSFMDSLAPQWRGNLEGRVRLLAVMLQNYVKADELTGQALHVRSGNLRRSITNRVTADGQHFTGIVGTNCVYARIHEFGGMTRPHDILPVHAKALLFQAAGFFGPMQRLTNLSTGRYLNGGRVGAALAEGGLQFARAVHHPGSHIPERSFLRAALDAKRAEIQAGLEAAVREATR